MKRPLGVGAGAHGKLTLELPQGILRTVKPKQPREYQEQVRRAGANAIAGAGESAGVERAGVERAGVGERALIAVADLPFEFMLNARARIIDSRTVEAGGKRFTGQNMVIGTGAHVKAPQIPGLKMHGVYDFATLIENLDYEPGKCVVIGGGKTAVEYGSFFNATGCETTIVTRSGIMQTPSLHHVDDDVWDYVTEGMRKRGITTPLIGDFHYIGHKLLAEYPACAEALDKYRINPGNVGFKNKRDTQFADIIEIANKNNKPVRIGANWGSLDQELLTKLMDENALLAEAKDVRAVTREAMVQSALLSAARAQELGMPKNRMIL